MREGGTGCEEGPAREAEAELTGVWVGFGAGVGEVEGSEALEGGQAPDGFLLLLPRGRGRGHSPGEVIELRSIIRKGSHQGPLCVEWGGGVSR